MKRELSVSNRLKSLTTFWCVTRRKVVNNDNTICIEKATNVKTSVRNEWIRVIVIITSMLSLVCLFIFWQFWNVRSQCNLPRNTKSSLHAEEAARY